MPSPNMQAKSTWTITPIRTVSNTPFYAMQLFLDHVTIKTCGTDKYRLKQQQAKRKHLS
nr:hypothetical protein [Listeria booriae]